MAVFRELSSDSRTWLIYELFWQIVATSSTGNHFFKQFKKHRFFRECTGKYTSSPFSQVLQTACSIILSLRTLNLCLNVRELKKTITAIWKFGKTFFLIVAAITQFTNNCFSITLVRFSMKFNKTKPGWSFFCKAVWG